MIYDMTTPADSEADLKRAHRYAEKQFGLSRRRALYATAALLLNCALIYPFLAEHSLHAYWESFGKYLLFPAELLPLVFLYYALSLYGNWSLRCDVRKAIEKR